MLYSFSNLIFMSNLQPFQAPLLFYIDKSKDVLIFCYFCPNRNTFHNFPRSLVLDKVFKVHSKLNAQGYGLHVRVEYPIGIPVLLHGDLDSCFKIFNGPNSNLKGLNKALSQCPFPETLQFSSVQTYMNITIALNKVDFPNAEWDTANWFVHVIVLESVFGEVPLEIVNLRSAIDVLDFDKYGKIIACVSIEDVSVFDFSMVTAMARTVWMGLIATVIIYAFVCKHILKAFDIMWPLFGICCKFNHQRDFFGVLLVSMVWLSSAYQGSISIEHMKFSEFPTLMDFMNNGYKIEIGARFRYTISLVEIFVPLSILDIFKPITKAMDLGPSNSFTDLLVSNSTEKDFERNKFTHFLKQCTKNKVVFAVIIHETFGVGFSDVLRNTIWVVEEQFYCKAFSVKKYLNTEFTISLRVNGYLTKKFVEMTNQWAQMGMMVKLQRLKASLRQINATGSLKVESIGALKHPGKIQLWSPVGIVALFCCSLALLLLLIQIFQWFLIFRNNIVNKVCIELFATVEWIRTSCGCSTSTLWSNSTYELGRNEN